MLGASRRSLSVLARPGGVAIGSVELPGPSPWPLRVGRVPEPRPDVPVPADPALGAADRRPLLLAGPPEAGTTDAAARCAEDAYRAGELDLLVWVRAASRESVIAAYARAARDVLPRPREDPAEAAEAFLDWLRPAGDGAPCRWLIVLDGVDDPSMLAGSADRIRLLPPSSPAGRVIATSRRRDVLPAPDAAVVELRTDEDRALVEAEVAAAIDHDPTGRAEAVLGILSVLDGNGVPWDVVESACSTATQPELRAALDELSAFRLVAGTGDPVRISPSVQAVARTRAGEDLPEVHRTAAEALLATWPDIDADAERGALLRANARVIFDGSPFPTPTPVCRRLGLRLARSLGEAGMPRAAVEFLRGSDIDWALWTELALWMGESGDASGAIGELRSLLEQLDGEPAAVLLVRRDLARWRAALGDAAALDEILAVTREQVELTGAASPESLACRARALAARMRLAPMRADLDSAAALVWEMASALGADHRETLGARALLTEYALLLDEPVPADAARAVVDDVTRVFGPRSPRAFEARRLQALSLDRPQDSRAALGELLGEQLRVMDPDHPAVLETRACAVAQRLAAGDGAAAVDEAEAVAADRLRVLGGEHVDTLASHVAMARCQFSADRDVATLMAAAQVVPVALRLLGAEHPVTRWARILRAAGRAEVAGGAVEALVEVTEVLGFPSPTRPFEREALLTARLIRAGCLRRLGDARGAAAAFDEIVDDLRRNGDLPELTAADVVEAMLEEEMEAD